MQEHFELHPSRTQLLVLLTGHALVALVIAVYFEAGIISFSALLLTALLALQESRHMLGQDRLLLSFDPRNAEFLLKHCGQSHFFTKYKVYANRWFAILKLVNNDQSRILILNLDRFESAHAYRNLRYLLLRTERIDAS